MEPNEAFDIRYLPAEVGEHNLHSELRVLRVLFTEKIIGNGNEVTEKLVDFGGSKAHCLLCAYQVLEALDYVNFFNVEKPNFVFPEKFRSGEDNKSVKFHYHLSTTSSPAQTMVPGHFYVYYRNEGIKDIFESHKKASLERIKLKKSNNDDQKVKENEEKIEKYFNNLVPFVGTYDQGRELPDQDGFTPVATRTKKQKTSETPSELYKSQNNSTGSETVIDVDSMQNEVANFLKKFPKDGKISVSNYSELQKEFIATMAKETIGYAIAKKQKVEIINIPAVPAGGKATAKKV